MNSLIAQKSSAVPLVLIMGLCLLGLWYLHRDLDFIHLTEMDLFASIVLLMLFAIAGRTFLYRTRVESDGQRLFLISHMDKQEVDLQDVMFYHRSLGVPFTGKTFRISASMHGDEAATAKTLSDATGELREILRKDKDQSFRLNKKDNNILNVMHKLSNATHNLAVRYVTAEDEKRIHELLDPYVQANKQYIESLPQKVS